MILKYTKIALNADNIGTFTCIFKQFMKVVFAKWYKNVMKTQFYTKKLPQQ